MNSETFFSRAVRAWQRLRLHAVLAVIILAVVIVRIRLLQVPLERDEGEFAYCAQLMLKGVPPYLKAYTLKLPGVPVMYAFFMALFGESLTGEHLGLLVVNVLSICMVYFLGRRLGDPVTGVVSGSTFAILSLGQVIFGVNAHATHFVMLFALAGMLLLLRALESGRGGTLVSSGAAFGCAFLMKQHGIFFAAFAQSALPILFPEARQSTAGMPTWRDMSRVPKSLSVFIRGI